MKWTKAIATIEQMQRKGGGMEYKAKLWLNKRQYIAVLDEYMVVVTTDESGKPIRWAIFGKGAKNE